MDTTENEAWGLLTPEQLAEVLGCGRSYAYTLIAGPTPAIPSLKIGRLRRIRREDVDRFIAERMRDAT